MSQKIFGITGWKNSGKTTLTERLVRCLTARGHRISTVKHAHHQFDIDHEGTDSWRHRKAGATEVAIVSAHRFAIMHENIDGVEPPLSEIIAKLAPCDLILVEGYKREPHKKIELRRDGGHEGPRLSETDPGIVAVVSDQPQEDEKLPVFDIDEIDKIAEFIEQEMRI